MLFTLPALVHTLFAPVNALRKKSVLRRSTDLVNFIQNPLSETDIAILSGNYLRFFTYHRWHFAVFYPIFRQWGYFKCRLGYQDFKDQICQGHNKPFRVCHSLFFWKVSKIYNSVTTVVEFHREAGEFQCIFAPKWTSWKDLFVCCTFLKLVFGNSISPVFPNQVSRINSSINKVLF